MNFTNVQFQRQIVDALQYFASSYKTKTDPVVPFLS